MVWCDVVVGGVVGWEGEGGVGSTATFDIIFDRFDQIGASRAISMGPYHRTHVGCCAGAVLVI